jgi:hypothetical protein
MFDIRISEDGKTAVINMLAGLEATVTAAAQKGLTRIGKEVHRGAHQWLSGAKTPAGAYPVPVVTGHLRRSAAWLKPGESKAGSGEIFTAGNMETVIYNSAAYAETIFLGKGSSAKFGERNAIIDGFNEFNRNYSVEKVLEEELEKELSKKVR